MNIQIFGNPKCFDSKKAERYFSERRIKVQYLDIRERQMSRGEWNNVKSAVGGFDKLIDENCRDKEMLTLLRHLSNEAREEKVFCNQVQLLKTPIVRNGKQATVGYAPEVWKTWN